ncbi:hypothetical protein [Streptomyces mirabilis]|uniref:hypothetical protein n=1 Tax=Streptomyces mirabilis TaxID=68239 RepID=UPI0033196441
MFGMAGGPTGRSADASGPDTSGPRESAALEPSADPDTSSDRHPSPEPEPNPTLTPDDIRRIAVGLDAVEAARHGLDDVLKSGDSQALHQERGQEPL